MANPFALSEIQSSAPRDAGNPFAQQALQDDARMDLRRSLLGAMDTNPEEAARATHLSRQVGAPYEAVQANLPQVERVARLDEYERMLAGAPKLEAFMRNPQNAQIAHDDVENQMCIRDRTGTLTPNYAPWPPPTRPSSAPRICASTTQIWRRPSVSSWLICR